MTTLSKAFANLIDQSIAPDVGDQILSFAKIVGAMQRGELPLTENPLLRLVIKAADETLETTIVGHDSKALKDCRDELASVYYAFEKAGADPQARVHFASAVQCAFFIGSEASGSENGKRLLQSQSHRGLLSGKARSDEADARWRNSCSKKAVLGRENKPSITRAALGRDIWTGLANGPADPNTVIAYIKKLENDGVVPKRNK